MEEVDAVTFPGGGELAGNSSSSSSSSSWRTTLLVLLSKEDLSTLPRNRRRRWECRPGGRCWATQLGEDEGPAAVEEGVGEGTGVVRTFPLPLPVRLKGSSEKEMVRFSDVEVVVVVPDEVVVCSLNSGLDDWILLALVGVAAAEPGVTEPWASVMRIRGGEMAR